MEAIKQEVIRLYLSLIHFKHWRAFGEGALSGLFICGLGLAFFEAINYFFGREVLKQVGIASYLIALGFLLGIWYSSYIEKKIYLKIKKEREERFSLNS